MDELSLLILPSPLLPATAYSGLAAALRALGVGATIAASDLGRGEAADTLIQRWAELVGPTSVLAPHSNAGYLAPSVRAACAVRSPIVFMDAALPPEAGSTALAPPGFRDFLGGLAGPTSILPPWTQWWPRADLADVIPDAEFAELDRMCPQLPLAYFDFSLTVPTGWASGQNAYLGFGATYDEEMAFAAARDWPLARLDGQHLHFLHRPGEVAAQLLGLAGRLTGTADRPSEPTP